MRSVLLAFQAESSGLRDFLAAAAAEEALYPKLKEIAGGLGRQDGDNIDIVLRSSLNRRRYTYVVAIIVLYGALERYIENVVERYIILISDVAGRYERLPAPLIKHHLELSIEYLWLVKESRVRVTESAEDIVSRLSGCIAGNETFEINARAFTLRLGNMNRDRVQRILLHAGIDVTPRRLSYTPSYRTRYAESALKSVDGLNDEEVQKLFREVDELVEARNRVAHGVTNVDEIEDRALIEARIANVEAYVQAVHEVMEQEILQFGIASGLMRRLEPVINVFNDNIVCIEHRDGEIKVGDLIAMTTQETMEPVRAGLIESIEIEREPQESVRGAPDLKIGMKVAMRASKKGHFYLVPADLHLAIRA